MDNVSDLTALLKSRHPLVVAESSDEARLLGFVREAATELELAVWTWSATRGLARDGFEPQYETTDARKALDFAAQVPSPSVFVFVDAHHALKDPLVVRTAKELALTSTPGRTVVLVCAQRPEAPELDGLALRWALAPPGREEIADLVRRTLRDLHERGFELLIDEDGARQLVDSLRGLSLREAEHLLQRAVLGDGKLDRDDVEMVRRRKAEMIDASGVLELIEADTGTLDDVGGMERLKEWLSLRGRALEPQAAEFGLDAPKGVLLTGVPGCGKSFVAKTLARTWGMPLVLLDPARLYGSYIGESEQRLARALSTVEAMAPAVLWVDEIEKGFAASGGRGDGGVSERIRGTFLRWMQERPDGIFVIATSNDVWALPPEFLRKGRFDEIFFVDLPSVVERREILELHLRRRDRDPATFNVDALVTASEGFSGAEIEAAVVGALYRAYARDRELTTSDILEELAETVPLSRSRAEDVSKLRAWARGRAVPAT